MYSVKKKTRESVDSWPFVIPNQRARSASWFGNNESTPFKWFLWLKTFRTCRLFQMEIEFQTSIFTHVRVILIIAVYKQKPSAHVFTPVDHNNCWFVRSLRYYGWSWTTEACLCRVILGFVCQWSGCVTIMDPDEDIYISDSNCLFEYHGSGRRYIYIWLKLSFRVIWMIR